jgi:4-amino-4-deoxy-L-arabinose transferase-like glycosyltransferase
VSAARDIAINRAVWLVWAGLLVFRVVVASELPLLGDEAFYWQESRALALSYSDVPPMTAWLIALGTALAGDTLLGVRWPFLLIGAALPLLMRDWACRSGLAAADADRLALIVMLMPLGTIAGILALPDAPLTLLMLSAFVALDRAAALGRWRDWFLLGVVLAAALLTHWRAALLFSTGLIWIAHSRRGAESVRRPGLWLALAIAMLALVPLLQFNQAHDWAALRFQLLERNPWAFQWSGLAIVPEQVLLLTPLLAASIVAAGTAVWRRSRGGVHDLVVPAVLGILLVYFALGVFADNERMRVHWPLPGYFPLLLAVPAVLGDWRAALGWRRWLARLYWPMLAAACLITMAVAGMLSMANTPARHWNARLFDSSLIGWPEAAAGTRKLLAERPASTIVIADNFLLAAELDFALAGARPLFVLDHPRNLKHGRQQQLAIWRRDQAGLRAANWSLGLLVVELAATERADQLQQWQALCTQFGDVRWLAEETVIADEVQFLYAEVRPPQTGQSEACTVPALARIDWPAAGQRFAADQALVIAGWAMAEPLGIAEVVAVIDGTIVPAQFERHPAGHVRQQWPTSRDPDQPNVGFRLLVDTRQLTPGIHTIAIEVRPRGRHALPRRFGARQIVVTR